MKKPKPGYYYCPIFDNLYVVYENGIYDFVFQGDYSWIQSNWVFAPGGSDYLGPL